MNKFVKRLLGVVIGAGMLVASSPTALAAEQTTSLFPSADAYVSPENNGATNYGSEQRAVLYMDFANTGRVLVRFDLSNIPAGATISSATLGFDLTYSSGTSSVTATAYRVTETWTENSVTKNSEPAHADEVATTIITNYPDKKTFDVTEAVRHWLDGSWANNGLKIIGREGASSALNYRRELGSRESGTPPTLAVTYTPPADIRAPSITNVSAAVQTDSSVIVAWKTDEPATASIEYGGTAEYGRAKNDVGYALEQRITLTGLAAGVYHYRVVSTDLAGNTARSGDSMFTVLTGGSTPPATAPPAGHLIKLACPPDAATDHVCKAVYYVARDGKRHAFPNGKIYRSWFADFSAVQIVSADNLSGYPLGKSVRYKPGSRLVKFLTLPKTYSVGIGGTLQWVTSEVVATALFGTGWNTLIDDLSDAFATDYIFGADINTAVDLSTGATPTITIDDDLVYS